MAIAIGRREFITLLGGGAAAMPLPARAQQGAMPVIGFLSSRTLNESASFVSAFRQGLAELGYAESQNAAIEFRWAHGDYEQLPVLANELVRRPVSILVSSGGTITVLAAKAATSNIPIVFTMGADPVALGLVASLSRPGGNITGVSFLSTQLDPKLLELLRQVVPKGASIAVLLNPKNPNADAKLNDIQTAARAIDQQLIVVRAGSEQEIEVAYQAVVEQRAGGLLIDADPFYSSRRAQLALLAVRHAVPTIFWLREYAVAGGLMSYGASYSDTHRLVGIYAGRILKGEKPENLPVIQPTKFEFVINLQAAKAIGLTMPITLLALADEVIE